MGNSKSHYSKQERLYYFIEKTDYKIVGDLLKQYPQLISKQITKDSKHTPLMRASFRGDLEMVKLLLEYGADINQINEKGETALITAIKRNHIDLTLYFLQKEVNIDLSTSAGLSVIDYAILPGFYQIAKAIYERMKLRLLKLPQQYYALGKKYSYRYVNYQMMIQGLVDNKETLNLNYLQKQKIKLNDPVIDPRETWKQWIKRVANFKDAPLVQREQLPTNLQPQNRILGKIHHYTYNFTSTPGSQKSVLYPQERPITQIPKLYGESGTQLGSTKTQNPIYNLSQP